MSDFTGDVGEGAVQKENSSTPSPDQELKYKEPTADPTSAESPHEDPPAKDPFDRSRQEEASNDKQPNECHEQDAETDRNENEKCGPWVRRTYRLHPDQVYNLDRLVSIRKLLEGTKLDVSDLIREAVDDYLCKHRDELKILQPNSASKAS